MSEGSPPPPPPPIPSESGDRSSPEPNSQNHIADSQNGVAATSKEETTTTVSLTTTRSNRPSRACTIRAAARLHSAAQPAIQRKAKDAKKEPRLPESPPPSQCSKIVTPLVEPPPPSQLPRWNLRSMWELASVLNFLHVSWKAVIFLFLGWVYGIPMHHSKFGNLWFYMYVLCFRYLGLFWISQLNSRPKSLRLLSLRPMTHWVIYIFHC